MNAEFIVHRSAFIVPRSSLLDRAVPPKRNNVILPSRSLAAKQANQTSRWNVDPNRVNANEFPSLRCLIIHDRLEVDGGLVPERLFHRYAWGDLDHPIFVPLQTAVSGKFELLSVKDDTVGRAGTATTTLSRICV